MSSSQTTQFLQRWHAGDLEGLNALLERHLPWLREQVHRQLGPVLRKKGDTSDYVQDAMVQFLRYAPRFTVSDEPSFRALVLRVAVNSLRNQYDWFTAKRRAIARERPLPADTVLDLDPGHGEVRTPSKSAIRLEREAWVRLGMELLGPEDREILILREWEDTPFPEIGERLGITQEAARMRHNRAALRLADRVWALRNGRLDEALSEGEESREHG
jgi:RNA polymerase sigma-70 factor (ECF subfamily)